MNEKTLHLTLDGFTGQQLKKIADEKDIAIGNDDAEIKSFTYASDLKSATITFKPKNASTGAKRVTVGKKTMDGSVTSFDSVNFYGLVVVLPDTTVGEEVIAGVRTPGMTEPVTFTVNLDGVHETFPCDFAQAKLNLTCVNVKSPTEANFFTTGGAVNGATVVAKGTETTGTTPVNFYEDAEVTQDKLVDGTSENVFEVKLLVNKTEVEEDDIVVRNPELSLFDKMIGTRNGTVGSYTYPYKKGVDEAGPLDNHIPLTVKLEGTAGEKADVTFTIRRGSNAGNVTLKDDNGNAIPNNTITMTVGTDVTLRIVGTKESADLNDVTIVARINGAKAGEEDLTCIWTAMAFRGNESQGQDITFGSTSKPSNFNDFEDYKIKFEDKVGLFKYQSKVSMFIDSFFNQMEIKVNVFPDKVIYPDKVTWDIKRNTSFVSWKNGAVDEVRDQWTDDDTFSIIDVNGESKQVQLDEDLQQDNNLRNLFSIDLPGKAQLTGTHPSSASQIANFQEWVEVRIGNKWYVASQYKKWHTLLHIRTKAENLWERYTPSGMGEQNEIVDGWLNGDSDVFQVSEFYDWNNIVIVTNTLPDGAVGKLYEAYIRSVGGTATVKW